MLNFFLFLFAALGIWKTAQYVSTFFEEQWLLGPQQRQLRAKFEVWWLSVAEMEPRSFAVALARVASELLSAFFGDRLFSKQSFVKAAQLATGLMLASMVLTNIMGASIKPWVEFERTLIIFKEAPAKLKANQTGSKDEVNTQVAETLKNIAENYGSWQWKAIY